MDDLRITSIQRTKRITLIVDGESVAAYQGETLLAALIASGRKVLRKHPVSGEGRGALCGMGVCFDCTVTVNGVHNVRSCMTEVEDKMEIRLND